MENTNNNVIEETQTTEEKATVETFTKEQMLAYAQSEADRRVSEALKTVQKKHEKELSLSKLDDEARAKAEKDNEIAELRETIAKKAVKSQVVRNRIQSRNNSK